MIIAEVCKYAPEYGGNFLSSLRSAERHIKELSKDSEVIYIFPQDAANKAWINDLEDNRVLFLPQGNLKSNFQLTKWCKQYRIDIMHVHFYGVVSTFLVGMLCKTKVINHFHNTLIPDSPMKSMLRRWLSRWSDKLVGCSKAVYDTLISGGYSLKKCSYITNCIDFSRLDQIGNTSPFDTTRTNLLILGTDFYRKGVDTTLKAVEPIATKYDICLHIVTNNETDTRNKVIEVMGEIPAWVEITPATETIGDYYRASKIFLSPSLNEGLCYAIPEALYCNCMVLKTDLPSMCYGLDNEAFITLEDGEDLGKRIESVLMMDDDERSQLITHLREQVIAKFSLDKWGSDVAKMYVDTMNDK